MKILRPSGAKKVTTLLGMSQQDALSADMGAYCVACEKLLRITYSEVAGS
jgi:hypothetical protein